MTRAYLVSTTNPPVPLETGEPWPGEGKEVELTRYVRRRLADEDLKPGTPRAAEPESEQPNPAGETSPTAQGNAEEASPVTGQPPVGEASPTDPPAGTPVSKAGTGRRKASEG